MKAITILAFLIVGLGVLAWGFVALSACLLPVAPGYSSRIFPSREGILLSQEDRLYQLSGQFGPNEVPGSGVGKCSRVEKVLDAEAGVFVITGIGDCPSNLYRFTAETGLKPVLGEEQYRKKFVRAIQAAGHVFVILTDAIYRLEAGKTAPQRLANVDECTTSNTLYGTTQYKTTNSFIFFPAANGSICQLGSHGLDIISGWPNDVLEGAAETSRGVFLWGRSGAYRLEEGNRVVKVEGISDDPIILDFYEMSLNDERTRVFAATTNGLFVYSEPGVLDPVPSRDLNEGPDEIHSVHKLQSGLYVLASNGVFHLSEEGSLERIGGKDYQGVKRGGYKTTKGVFFIDFKNQIYRFTDINEVPPVVLPQANNDAAIGGPEKPIDIKNTKVGPLLATNRAVYRFSKANTWVLVPGGDFGRDVNLVPINDVRDDVPVFINTEKGVFKWIESPFDVKWIVSPFDIERTKEPWNYIAIFWDEVGFILVGLLWILFVFVHYSLYRYRWIRYYVLGLVSPSLVHNQVFISYRRADTGGHARYLYLQLCRRFDHALIFFDLESIEAGDEFPLKLHNAVKQCSVLLALISSDWLNVRNRDGIRRLDDPTDYVRQEISLALEGKKDVIPVRFGDVDMPDRHSLPEPLERLSDYHAVQLRVGTKTSEYKRDVNKLAKKIAESPNIPPPRKFWGSFWIGES